MKTVLIISSFVSASRVGATAGAFCLRRLGIDAIVLPTTLMGRHPGWGNPGGGAIDVTHLEKMWTAIKAQNIKFDAVLTGYMGDTTHIALCETIIKDVKSTNPTALILVDPVMGDHGSLYIPENRAKAIAETLIPLADITTPNLWELSYLARRNLADMKDVTQAAERLASMTLVTSVRDGDKIGALLTVFNEGHTTRHIITHKRFETVPHGGGDALAATYLAHILIGKSAAIAMEQAVASIFHIMSAANKTDAGELPLVREQNALIDSSPLKSQDLNS